MFAEASRGLDAAIALWKSHFSYGAGADGISQDMMKVAGRVGMEAAKIKKEIEDGIDRWKGMI